MRYKVAISPRASRMLAEHAFFMAQVSPTAAKRMKEEVICSIRSLTEHPLRFRSLFPQDAHSAYRIMPAGKWYGVIYLVQDSVVYVEYVIDYRQDYQWLMEEPE